MSPVVEVDKYSPVFFRNVRVLADDDDDGDTSSRGGGLGSQQIQQIVDHHNQLRAGEGASNMEKMVLQTTCSCTARPILFIVGRHATDSALS